MVRQSTRAGSLALRLGTLLLVPTLGMSALALGRISHERSEAGAAEATLEGIAFESAVAQVHPAGQLELIARQGLARIDELGISRDLVAMIGSVDIEQQAVDNRTRYDDALRHLETLIRASHLSEREEFTTRIEQFRAELASVRARNDRGEATPDEIQAIIDSNDALLGDFRETATSDLEPRGRIDPRQMRLATFNRVLASAGARGQATMRAVLYPSTAANAAMMAADLVHQADLVAHRETMPTDWHEAFDALDPPTGMIPTMPAEPGQPFDPQMIALSNDIAMANVAYSTRLSSYGETLTDELVDEARRETDRALARSRLIGVLLIVSLVVTIALMWFVLWSLLQPIRQLTRRAHEISEGELELPPLEPTGPADVRALMTTTNEMMTTLNQVHAEIARLAAGDVGNETTGRHLPGAIGVSLRESIERLAEVTARLHRSEQFASAVVDEAADAIWTIGTDGRIRSANAAAVEVVGVAADEQIGQPIDRYLPTTKGDTTVWRPGGEERRVLVASNTVDVGGECFEIVIAHDISERAHFEEQLAYQAGHDSLTGLPNRYSLLRHLDHVIPSEPVAVCFIDLDGFKNVNDTKGHAIGDDVLRTVARHLRGAVDEGDFVARLGGDEFVVVTSGASTVQSALDLGTLLIDEIERPIVVAGEVFSLSASIGVTIPTAGTTALETIAQADSAVYQAKRRGRRRVEFFDAALRKQVEHDAEIELALRHAVRNEELELHLQPVVDVSTGRTVAAEALVRWHRPGHGLLPPDEFIPLAERSSLIFEIERWVLGQACSLLARWQVEHPGSDLGIAVNVSGRHLIDGHLVADVDHALTTTGADPSRLELELTETQLLEDLDRATELLEELRSRGLSIAADDFGTGYSSLTYLRQLPIDSVKLDRSFVANVDRHGFDATVIEALLMISRDLGLIVVAEGVETIEQHERLRTLGCDRAQGHLFARAMPASEFVAGVSTASV